MEGPDGRGGPGRAAALAEPQQPPVGERLAHRWPVLDQVELPGVGGQEPVGGAGGRRRPVEEVGEGVDGLGGGPSALFDALVLAQPQEDQREPGVRLGRVRQPAPGRRPAAGLGGGVVRVARHQGLFGEHVRVRRGLGAGAGGQQRDERVAAVGDLDGEFVVGDTGEPAEFVGDEFDQFAVAERVPAVRRSQFGAYGTAAAAHAEQPAAAPQPVHGRSGGPGPGRPRGLGRIPEQAVQERGGGVRVGGGVEVHWFHSVHPVGRWLAKRNHQP